SPPPDTAPGPPRRRGSLPACPTSGGALVDRFDGQPPCAVALPRAAELLGVPPATVEAAAAARTRRRAGTGTGAIVGAFVRHRAAQRGPGNAARCGEGMAMVAWARTGSRTVTWRPPPASAMAWAAPAWARATDRTIDRPSPAPRTGEAEAPRPGRRRNGSNSDSAWSGGISRPPLATWTKARPSLVPVATSS